MFFCKYTQNIPFQPQIQQRYALSRLPFFAPCKKWPKFTLMFSGKSGKYTINDHKGKAQKYGKWGGVRAFICNKLTEV
jgi:hypothetical protein